jgi:hypothetical protein
LHDGVLTVRIPVAEQAKPRKVHVGQGLNTAPDAIQATSDAGSQPVPFTGTRRSFILLAPTIQFCREALSAQAERVSGHRIPAAQRRTLRVW